MNTNSSYEQLKSSRCNAHCLQLEQVQMLQKGLCSLSVGVCICRSEQLLLLFIHVFIYLLLYAVAGRGWTEGAVCSWVPAALHVCVFF